MIGAASHEAEFAEAEFAEAEFAEIGFASPLTPARTAKEETPRTGIPAPMAKPLARARPVLRPVKLPGPRPTATKSSSAGLTA
jgi:hypothetical protein